MHKNHNKWTQSEQFDTILREIGLQNSHGQSYKARTKKHQQVYSYIDHLEKVLNRLSQKREILLVDCACGKSYLSFVANYYFTKVQNRNLKFICIDYNEQVIESSKRAAQALDFTNMSFVCEDIFKVDFEQKPDVVYSLHACDTATDMTIAKGIIEDAKFILTVSCCQHTVRESLRNHGLGAMTRHGIYKERLSDMVADSMRTLLLESKGYKVSLFEYVPVSETPKNIMLRASRIGTVSPRKSEEKMQDYNKLHDVFNTEPRLNAFVEKGLHI